MKECRFWKIFVESPFNTGIIDWKW